MDYFYDGQLRRYWLQFTRIFSNFQYESGIGADGTKALRTFPVSLAGRNRQVGHILRNNSENTILGTPRITCEMTDIQLAPIRRQTPNHVSTVNIFERAIDPATNRYTGELGKTYTVERYMAVPYDITMRVNVWTSNESQKHQFMEQVLQLFNPSIDLQTGDNPIDWTSLTIVELDSVIWSNRDMPIGPDDDIEISSLMFKMPIWISPPAKVKKQNIINQIITNIGEMNQSYKEDQAGGYAYSDTDLYTRIIVTPNNHQAGVEVKLDQDSRPYCEITLLSEEGLTTQPNGEPFSWRSLLQRYGAYRKGVSQFRIKTTSDLDDHESDIIGTFDFHPTDENKILWSPYQETLPVNTLSPIHGMISLANPVGAVKVGRWPGDGNLPEAITGQRYLLADDLPPVPEWTNLSASTNDIIEYDGSAWKISFDASSETGKRTVLNTRSGKQLTWNGEVWIDAISGDYRPGAWRVFL